MSEFNMQQAIAVCTATLKKREENKKPTACYRLYFSNDGQTNEFISGHNSIKLRQEFLETYTQYKFAVVTLANSFEPIWFYNRDVKKKFTRMKAIKRKAKQN